ncbi:MAG TPA: E3 binding domain-containing protein, partial [Candidatus Dormibacteraeota bacterium]|nr:E3 binding domain-containing protein [Candidatus Dormibacteraeota bacterium]
MPKLSDTMEEGTIVEWKKKSGDVVKKGDVIAEVESDKATFDLESEDDGVLNIIVEQGVPAKIGAPIARIGAAEAAPASKPAAKEPAKEAPRAKAVEPKAEPVPAAPSPAAPSPPAEGTRPTPAAPGGAAGAPRGAGSPGAGSPGADGAPRGAASPASPLAKRLAAELGVDLGAVQGTGPEGRIVKEDVESAAAGRSTPMRAPVSAAPRQSGPDVEVVEPNRMQATIARRMVEAK